MAWVVAYSSQEDSGVRVFESEEDAREVYKTFLVQTENGLNGFVALVEGEIKQLETITTPDSASQKSEASGNGA